MTARLYSLAERREARQQGRTARANLERRFEVAWGAFHVAHALWIQQPNAETYFLRLVAHTAFKSLADQLDRPPEGPSAA